MFQINKFRIIKVLLYIHVSIQVDVFLAASSIMQNEMQKIKKEHSKQS